MQATATGLIHREGKDFILFPAFDHIQQGLCSCGMRWSWWYGWVPSPFKITCTRNATFQVKQMMLPYNTIMFLIEYILFRLDTHVQGRAYILSIKVGHWSQRCWQVQEWCAGTDSPWLSNSWTPYTCWPNTKLQPTLRFLLNVAQVLELYSKMGEKYSEQVFGSLQEIFQITSFLLSHNQWWNSAIKMMHRKSEIRGQRNHWTAITHF